MSSVSSNSSPLFFALTAALAIGCSQPPKPAPPPEPEPEPVADAPAEPPDDGIPSTAAGDKLRWVLGMLNGDGDVPTEGEYTSMFAAAFVAKVPYAQFSGLARQMRGGAPYTLVEIKDGATDRKLVAVIATGDQKLGFYLSVDGDDRIEGLLVRPEHDVKPVASWDQLRQRLDAAGARAQFLAAKLDDRGRCVEIASDEPGDQLGIGSSFKLYILLALHEQVKRGRASWDAELEINDELKSLPSGTMQNLAAGTKKTVKEFALKMISISDNTATDHLLERVGRQRVEAAVRKAGHSDPKRNVPFLSTREFFALKLAVDDETRERFLKMSAARKRRFADRELRKEEISLAAAAEWKTPRHIDKLEWFASSRDLCKVMSALKTAGDTSPEIREVMSANPGVAIDKKVWTYAGYKGGSEPGVMNLTWLLQNANGGWYVFSLGVNDTEKALDEGAIAAIGQAALVLFGNEVAGEPE